MQKLRNTKRNATLSAWCKELIKCEVENGSTVQEAKRIAEELKEKFSEQPVDNLFDEPSEDQV